VFFDSPVNEQFQILKKLLLDLSIHEQPSPHTEVLLNAIRPFVLFGYLILLLVLASYAGLLVNQMVRKFKWDARTKFFRFGNIWYYYFSGRYLDFPNVQGSSNQIDLVFVDVLVKSGEKDILYVGLCDEYNLSEGGGLESIGLKGVKRRYLEHTNVDQKIEKTDYIIPANLFVIPINESIVNINFRYFSADALDNAEPDEDKVDRMIARITLVYYLAEILKIFKSKKLRSEKSRKGRQKKGGK
jgi:hypothetical protein